MRTSQEIVDWLASSIRHIYSRPGMYARTQNDLHNQLGILHAAWAYAVSKETVLRREHRPLCKPESPAERPAGF